MNISVVVPVFNADKSLRELVSRLSPVLDALCENYELILVNDGSEDRSWETITQLAAENAWIRGIDLMRNYGQHNALLCGIRAAKHEIVVTLDDDLQHPPEEIPKLVQKLAEGYDIVYGIPEKKQHGRWRNIASFVTRWTMRSTLGSKVPKISALFARSVTQTREAFQQYHSPFRLYRCSLDLGQHAICVDQSPSRYTTFGAFDLQIPQTSIVHPAHDNQLQRAAVAFREPGRICASQSSAFSCWFMFWAATLF